MRKLISLVIIIFSLNTLNAQEAIEPFEVSENLYAIENPQGGNIAFLVTRKGVVVVDAGSTPSNGKMIVEAIKTITNKPIKYVILTHSHGDHINGIAAFPNDVKIIAYKDLENNNTEYNEKKIDNYKDKVLPEYLKSLQLQMESIVDKESKEYLELLNQFNNNQQYLNEIDKMQFRKPDITFEDYYRFKIADERIMLEYPGPGHTNDNIIVKFSNHNVIHTGDLVFNKYYPYLITEHGVDVYNWIRILDDLYKENIITVIPGHGEVDRKICLKDQSDYFKTLSQKIEELSNQGYKLDEIKEKINPKDFNLTKYENQLPINIEVIYNEIAKKGRAWWKF